MDAPSGIWAAEEYTKLASYDLATPEQPARLFLCHLVDASTGRKRICAGWAGCHDGDDLLALRVGVMNGQISPETAERVRAYVSPVPLFSTGAQAAAHGLRDLAQPGDGARQAIAKIVRVRSDIKTEGEAKLHSS